MNRRAVLVLGVAGLAAAAGIAFSLEHPPGFGASVDAIALLPPPPAAGSATALAERAAFDASAAGIGSPRWREAAREVFPTGEAVTAEISCALGRKVSPATTPATARLLAKVAADIRSPVEAAKIHFHRDRPFVGGADARTCDPRTLGGLGARTGGTLNYAYPSGHAAYGEIWGQTLALAAPDRADAVRAWGRRLGDNRVSCRVHWPSDIAAGRTLADAAFARLQTLPAFREAVRDAATELATAPPLDCSRQ